jgi:predicted peroxiredoxin
MYWLSLKSFAHNNMSGRPASASPPWQGHSHHASSHSAVGCIWQAAAVLRFDRGLPRDVVGDSGRAVGARRITGLVSIFMAGDAVQLIREGVLGGLAGLSTGNLRELYDGIAAGGGRFYLSGGSSKARGVREQDIAGKPAEFAGPPQLVRLSLEHDRMFTY